jgi:hypothetical protein
MKKLKSFIITLLIFIAVVGFNILILYFGLAEYAAQLVVIIVVFAFLWMTIHHIINNDKNN